MDAHKKEQLKGFVLFIGTSPADIKQIDEQEKADNIGLCRLEGPGNEAIKLYHINPAPAVRNTVLVYKDRQITARFVNLDVSKQGPELEKALAAICH